MKSYIILRHHFKRRNLNKYCTMKVSALCPLDPKKGQKYLKASFRRRAIEMHKFK
jgi:hypothetical protein